MNRPLTILHHTDSTKKTEVVVAFAKWSHPIFPGEDYVETPWIWPDGTDLDTLRAWTAKAAEAESRCIGDNPCYRMSQSYFRTLRGKPRC